MLVLALLAHLMQIHFSRTGRTQPPDTSFCPYPLNLSLPRLSELCEVISPSEKQLLESSLQLVWGLEERDGFLHCQKDIQAETLLAEMYGFSGPICAFGYIPLHRVMQSLSISIETQVKIALMFFWWWDVLRSTTIKVLHPCWYYHSLNLRTKCKESINKEK